MGVGGQFAAGVTLLSESMPNEARTKTIGILAIVATVCNMMAASLATICNYLDMHTALFQSFPVWRTLFIVGFAPALLAIAVIRHLKEPQAWKDAIASGGVKKAGSIPDLFQHPQWRYNVIVGMCLATCGVIGLWGIGFFSADLTQTAFRDTKNLEARERGDIETMDFELIRMLAANPKEFLPISREKKLTPQSFIGLKSRTNDAGEIYRVIDETTVKDEKGNTKTRKRELSELDGLNVGTIPVMFDDQTTIEVEKLWWQSAKQRLEEKRNQVSERLIEVLAAPPQKAEKGEFERLAVAIAERTKQNGAYVTMWGSITMLLFNFGAIFGTWGITLAAERWGRRIAFTLFFGVSFFMTIFVFLTMGTGITGNAERDVLIMQPILGFCILSIFGGYAIYFPELFPTRLRSTGVSFCYNIGRIAAATGPAALGMLTAYVFYNMDVPIRGAGAAMAVTFIFGIIFAWLGPETKGKPLPEE
jgi:hypothetical protein